ncbi:Rapid ALkalinization Factor [Dillenia turbinata]|uniref:Rapid ALkalinization Factor n=1 Tax=Dillenia turbinata TaxID=194707 RepID=A0AAN8UZ33_9MAGN
MEKTKVWIICLVLMSTMLLSNAIAEKDNDDVDEVAPVPGPTSNNIEGRKARAIPPRGPDNDKNKYLRLPSPQWPPHSTPIAAHPYHRGCSRITRCRQGTPRPPRPNQQPPIQQP